MKNKLIESWITSGYLKGLKKLTKNKKLIKLIKAKPKQKLI